MVQLTKMQQRIYDYIAQTIRTQGYPPSVREIGDAVGLKSPSTVHFHLKHMEELGVIGKGAGKGRALTLTEPLPEENQIPIVGTVAAGTPILAEECIEDYLTFDAGGDSSQYFALRVRGSPCSTQAFCRTIWWWCASSRPLTTARSWWPCWGTRPRSSAIPAATGRCGSCRRMRRTAPLTATTHKFWGRWPPSSGAIKGLVCPTDFG